MELLHGGNIYDDGLEQADLLDFSANMNPMGMPEGVKRAIIESLLLAEHYPDPLCRKLRRALAAEYGMTEDYFICGNGGADLIYRLVYALRPRKALLTAPTFAEYEEALKQTGTEIFLYDTENFRVQSGILEQMDGSVDVMFLCNPNNPTGLLVDQDLLLQILEKADRYGIWLVLDECFLDFTGQLKERSLVSYIPQYSHLFILKSFTKMYAMPGLRLGYGISRNKELLERMEASGQCWGVSVLASEAGIAALKEKEYREKAIRLVKKERDYLKKELEGIGMRVWDGQADYLFFQAPEIHDLYEQLLPYGILIRHCRNYRRLDDTYYRIAVRDHESNERLINVLKKARKKGKENDVG